MASLRERLLKRSAQTPAPGTEAASNNGTQAPAEADKNTFTPVSTTQVSQISMLSTLRGRTTLPGRSSVGSRTGHSFVSRIDTQVLSPVEQLKVDLQRRLIERLDLEALEQISDEAVLIQQIRNAVVEFLRTESTPLSQGEREEVIEQIVYEVTGLGPLEPLFRDYTITDILVNGPKDVYVERKGKLSRVPTNFRNDAHLLAIIDRIVSRVGRRVDESSPMVDARLPDGSRINAIIPPLALDGPSLSIRRFGKRRYAIDDLVAKDSITPDMVEFIRAIIRARLNVLVCGGTGSGKTTMLNCISAFIPVDERVVTIEDSAELVLQQPHVVRLETRPPNVEGKGEVTARELVRNTLRMRPDRIIVGEVRGSEVFDMLQAMSTGHDGSLCTIHANTPRDSMGRLEMMMLLAGWSIPQRAMRQQIASALNVIVHVSRLSDGTRKLLRISELVGMEGDMIMMQDLYEFHRTGVNAQGKVLGQYRKTGIRSAYKDRIEAYGYSMD